MSIFTKILSKLGINKKEEDAAPAASASAKTSVASAPAAAKPAAAAPAPVAKPAPAIAKDDNADLDSAKTAAPSAISEVDVVKKLEELGKGKKLDWKVSIVDLLKLLELDSSFEARKELATELGCPADFMGDSAKMNTWLHKEVLRRIALSGGNIPKELLN